MKNVKKYWLIYLMMLPGFLYLVIFHFLPMYGIVIAFQDFQPFGGIEGIFIDPNWVGLKHFKAFFNSFYFERTLFNTLFINFLKLGLGFLASLVLALMINEVRNKRFKKFTQTVSYLPHFLSYVIIAGLIQFFLSPTSGPVNTIITYFGGQPIDFLGSELYFRSILIISHIWTTVGWGSIVYLAALSGISPELYESADLDGATRIQKMIHISVPTIAPIIVIMLILDMGKILDQGFEQVLLLYSPAVYEVGDIIDTYVYREGILNVNYTAGRVVNPGHDIECSWFVMEQANYAGDAALHAQAQKMFRQAIEAGWDKEYGGLLYFVDCLGKPTEAYEHDMKLWWPHNEILIASAMAYRDTKDEYYLEWFFKTLDYCREHFADPEYGEWYGYLRRDGLPTMPSTKGSTFKGPFHLPRMLAMVDQMLDQILSETAG